MLRSFDFSFIMHPFNSQPALLIFQSWRLMTYISTPIKHTNSLLFIALPLIFFSFNTFLFSDCPTAPNQSPQLMLSWFATVVNSTCLIYSHVKTVICY